MWKSRRAVVTITGGAAGTTSKLETNARWSVGHGVIVCITPSSSPPSSPQITASVVVAGPAAYTKSIRSRAAWPLSPGL